MKKSTFIVFLAIILVGYFIYPHTVENVDYQICPSTSYPKERSEWERSIFGTPATFEQSKKIRQHIEAQLKSKESGPYRDAGVMEWDELGPKNIGGRIRGVALHPTNNQILYIGGTGGGVWKSSNAGSSWTQITPEQWAYPVTSIQVDPNDADKIYVATGESDPGGLQYAGKGVLKTTDGGITWTNIQVLDTDSIPYVNKILIDPLNSSILYACGGKISAISPVTATAYKSTDSGDTWTRIFLESSTYTVCYDMEINPNTPDIMYLGTNKNLYKTEDGGNNWNTELGTGPNDITTLDFGVPRRCELNICSSDPDVIWVLRHTYTDYPSDTTAVDSTYSEVWKTTDNGVSWNMITYTAQLSSLGNQSVTNILGKQGDYDNTIWADPSDCDRAILGGIDLWKYDNGLERISNWPDDIGACVVANNNSVHADQHLILPAINYNGTTGNQVYFGNDGGLYRSNNIWSASLNSGWLSLVDGLRITQLYAIDVDVTGDLLYAGSQDNSYFWRDNGNSNTLNWDIYCSGDGGHGARLADPDVFVNSTQFGIFNITYNGGTSFIPFLNLQNLGNVAFIAPLEKHPISNLIYMGGDRLYSKSTLPGSNHTMVRDTLNGKPVITSIALSSNNPQLIYLGYSSGTVWRTLNGGASWFNVTPPGSPSASVTDIDVSTGSDNNVAITFGGGYRINGLFTSNNGGSSWDVRTDSIPLIHLTVTHHPENADWIYIGTSDGIFASENQGEDWSITPLYNENEGPVTNMVIELVWQGDGTSDHPYYLLAGTHGRGAWRSKLPIRKKYYIDKTCTSCGLGTWESPFQTFIEAVNKVGTGITLEFKTGGDYDEVSSALIIEKRLTIKKHSSSSNVTIK